MPRKAPLPDGKRVLSVYTDVDVDAWLRERAGRLSRSINWQISQILRAAMDAEKRQEEPAA